MDVQFLGERGHARIGLEPAIGCVNLYPFGTNHLKMNQYYMFHDLKG